MTIHAFAKINLSLRVLGAAAGGYHEIRTVFQSLQLHDTLTIRRARGPLRLMCSDPARCAAATSPARRKGPGSEGRARARVREDQPVAARRRRAT